MKWRGEFDELKAFIEAHEHVDISGDRGMGKSTMIDEVSDEYEETLNLSLSRGEGKEEIFRQLIEYFQDDSLYHKGLDKLGIDLDSVSVNIPFLRGTFSSDGSDSLEAELQEAYKSGDKKEAVVFIDDIQNLSSDRYIVRGLIERMAEICDGCTFVTVGTLKLPADANIDLGPFSKQEIKEYLEANGLEYSQEELENIHEDLGGHPYFIDLLADLSQKELPEEKKEGYIHDEYLSSLNHEEEDFLKRTSVLLELDSHLCSEVLDKGETESNRILRELEERSVVREVDKQDGISVYKVHDIFRGYLQDRLKEEDKYRRRAFRYYCDRLVENDGEGVAEGFALAALAENHLNELVEGPDDMVSEFELMDVEQPARFRFAFEYSKYFLMESEKYKKFLREETSLFIDHLEGDERAFEPFFILCESILYLEFDKKKGIERLLDLKEDLEGGVYSEPMEATFQEMENFNEARLFLSRVLRGLILFILISEDEENRESNSSELKDLLSEVGLNRKTLEKLSERFGETADTALDSDNLDIEKLISSELEEAKERISDEPRDKRKFFMLEDLLDDIEKKSRELLDSGEIIGEVGLDEEGVIIEIEGIGHILESAENPIFPLLWYTLWKEVLGGSGAFNRDKARYFDRKIVQFLEDREEYELENEVHVSVEDLDLQD